MAQLDVKNNLIQGKIVYYGPGLCGKTTNLEYINRAVRGSKEMVSLSTQGDRTIFFDYLPIELGKIRGISTSFKLYTVPGQVRYNLTRKMVLKNVDGVVFVADSQRLMIDSNIESWENLFSNLRELKINPDGIPMVLQYNKRDLPDVLSREELDKAFKAKGYPVIMASAVTGEGVVETLAKISMKVYEKIVVDFGGTEKVERAVTKRGIPPVSGDQAATARRKSLSPKEKAAEKKEDSKATKLPKKEDSKASKLPKKEDSKVAKLPTSREAGAPVPDEIIQLLNEQHQKLVKIFEKGLKEVTESIAAGVKKEVAALDRKPAEQIKSGALEDNDKKELQSLLSLLSEQVKGGLATRKDLEELRAAMVKPAGPEKGGALSPKDLEELRREMARLSVDSTIQMKVGLPSKPDMERLQSAVAALTEQLKERTPPTKTPPAAPELGEIRQQLAALSAQVKESLTGKSSLTSLKEDISTLLRQNETRIADMERSVKEAVDEIRKIAAETAKAISTPVGPPTEPPKETAKAAVAPTPPKPVEQKPPEPPKEPPKAAEAPPPPKAVEQKPPEPPKEPAKAAEAPPPTPVEPKPAEPPKKSAKAAEAPPPPTPVEPKPAAEPPKESAKAAEAPPPPKPVEPKPEEDLSNDPRHINAARIARVMVADIELYHAGDVAEGIKTGDIQERLKNLFEEMRKTYASRVPEDVRNKKDYLQEAIDNYLEKKRKDLGVM